MDETLRRMRFAELAPLTRSFSIHLAQHLLKSFPREAGRPRKGEQEQRMLEALDMLTLQVREERDVIFPQVDSALREGQLAAKWFIQVLNHITPGETMIYPQRITEWKNGRLLFLRPDGQLDPQCVCCIIITRMLHSGRTAWLPPRPLADEPIESFWVWRWDDVRQSPFPYEMPIEIDPQKPTAIKRTPILENQPYILGSPWKGAAWDDPEWMLVEGGAARWVGLPSENQLAAWLSPQEIVSLAPSTDRAGRAKQALRILADRLPHRSSSNAPMLGGDLC